MKIESELNDAFPSLLKNLRNDLGLTLKDCAKRLGSKHTESWGAYERGDRQPSIEQARKLLAALGYELCIDVRKLKDAKKRIK